MKQLISRYRYSAILLRQLVITDFKLRYQSSVLGYVWSLLKPLALFLILYVVFVKFIGVGASMPHISVYLLLGVVLWMYFTEVTGGSISAIVSKGDMLRKVNFPRYVLVFAGSFAALINLALSLVIVMAFAIVDGVDFKPTALFLPLVIFELFVFATSLAFFLSAAFVRFRDIHHIWEVILQGAFYATPILYLISDIPRKAAKLLLLNPMAQIIQDARYAFVTHQTETISSVYGTPYARLIPLAICLLVLVISIRFFRKRSKHFAEEV